MPYEAGQLARFVIQADNNAPSNQVSAAYAAHNNHPVVVVRRIQSWLSGAYEILAVDGWEGMAYENELQPLPECLAMKQGSIVRFTHRRNLGEPQDVEAFNNGKPVVIVSEPASWNNTFKVMGIDGSVFFAHPFELQPLPE